MSKCRRDKIIPHGLSVYVEPWIGNQDEAFLGTWHKSFGWSNVAKFNKVILCVQWNNYFDSTKYLYIQQNIYLYIQWNNYLYVQKNYYFDSMNYLCIQRIIYIFNERIIFIQPIKYIYLTNELKYFYSTK